MNILIKLQQDIISNLQWRIKLYIFWIEKGRVRAAQRRQRRLQSGVESGLFFAHVSDLGLLLVLDFHCSCFISTLFVTE